MDSAEDDHLVRAARRTSVGSHLRRWPVPDGILVGEAGAIPVRPGRDLRIPMPPRQLRDQGRPRPANQRGAAWRPKRHKGRLPVRQRQLGRNSCGMPRQRARQIVGSQKPENEEPPGSREQDRLPNGS
jgi:hypothetical protein